MAGLNMSIIKSMPVVLPPIELQQLFVRRSLKIQSTHAKQILASDLVDALFDSLQERAFSGRL